MLLSLKGELVTWRGLQKESEQSPGAGAFSELLNVYPNSDATELRRAPGLVPLTHHALLDIEVDGTLTHSGGNLYLLDLTSGGAWAHNIKDLGLQVVSSCVRLEFSSPYEALTGFYEASYENASRVLVNLQTSPSSGGPPSTTTLKVRVSRQRDASLHPSWQIAQVLNYNVILARGYAHDPSTPATHYGLCASVVPVFSLQADSADYATATLWKQIQLNRISSDLSEGGAGSHAPWYRSYASVADGRLLIAQPDMACCFEAHLRAWDNQDAAWSDDDKNVLIALGTHKAPEPYSAAWGAYASGVPAGGHIWVRIGYRNRITGEFGLSSEPVKYTNSGGVAQLLTLKVYPPRHTLHENAGGAIYWYCSAVNGSAESMFLHGVDHVGDALRHPSYPSTEYQRNFGNDTENTTNNPGYNADIGPQDIEQMPQGARWIVSSRAFTFFGGKLGEFGSDLSSYGLSVQVGSGGSRELVHPSGSPGSDRKFPIAGARVPAAYQGNQLCGQQSQLKGNYTYLGLWRQHNLYEADDKLEASTQSHLRLLLRKGLVQVSEAGKPGVVPATRRALFDRLQGLDMIAGGRMGDSVVICTEEETYVLTWGRSPHGADPVLVSDRFGALGAHSMFAWDGGLAWLSRRGPVSFGGSVDWIGNGIEELFRDGTVNLDEDGLAPHACGCYDRERNLLIWAVHTDWANGTSWDTALASTGGDRSNWGNDTLLIYNPASRGWSIIRLPFSQSGIVDLKWMRFENGEQHVVALNRWGALFRLAWDGSGLGSEVRTEIVSWVAPYATVPDGELEPVLQNTPWNTVGQPASTLADWIASDTRWSFVPFYIKGSNGALKCFGDLRNVYVQDMAKCELSVGGYGGPGISAVAGDELVIGHPIMDMTWTYGHFGRADRYNVVRGLTLRHDFLNATEAWAYVTVIDRDGNERVMHGQPGGYPLDVSKRSTVVAGGHALSREMGLRIRIISDGECRLKDVLLEASASG